MSWLIPSKAIKHHLFLPDEAATRHFAAIVAQHCYFGMIIYLQGQLGAGKTTFTRGFLQALGYPGRIKSPTFTLVEPYIVAQETRKLTIYHFDFYRLLDPKELYYLGLDDYINEENICLMEWPEKAGTLLPPPHLQIQLTAGTDMNTRHAQLIINDSRLTVLMKL